MMQAIHNHTKGIISKIILSLVVITFVLWGVQGFIMSRALDTAVATVNGTEIEAHQFQNRLQQAMNQMTTRYDASLLDQPMFKENIKRQLLQEMINEELLKQASNYLGLKIGDEQLRKAIEHIPAFQQDGKFSEELFSQYLARDNGRELYANLENELIERQLRSAFSMGSFVLDNEIDKAIQLYKEKRDFSYVQISAEKQTPKALPSQQALKDFYTRQKERYAISEKVSLAYLELDVEALKKNIKVDWKDIETRYNENIAQYKTAKRWHLAHLVVDSQDEKGKALAKKIQSEINKGADFRKLAKKHSMDLITSQEGGDLGLLTERMLTREMKLALKKLKPGQVSTPYVDKHGTVFLKLIEIKEPKVTPLKLVQEKIRNEIKSERVGKQYSDMAE